HSIRPLRVARHFCYKYQNFYELLIQFLNIERWIWHVKAGANATPEVAYSLWRFSDIIGKFDFASEGVFSWNLPPD
ncbi:hypothetical protein AB1Y39_21125, partial [Escherichia coli]|uniref:hypothetical protein n=1 Tax=Escherichia coli TaxID=562 RepID=UPI00345BE542